MHPRLPFSIYYHCVLFLLLFFTPLLADKIPQLFQTEAGEAVTVDLREPIYSDGILSTTHGGVIKGPKLRLQALNISYARKDVEGIPSITVEAEDQLIIEFGEYVFVGKKLFYNFTKKEGVIYDACTEVEPWFLCGKRFELRADGSYVLHEGYLTTSENMDPEWGIFSNNVTITSDNLVSAKKVQLRLYNYNIFWVPSIKANLNTLLDSPIRYRFRWGGRQGPRLGLTYEVFSLAGWKTFARFDYRFTRGPGAGIEIHYHSNDKKTELHSINYIAKDSSIIRPHEKVRYRYEGLFRKVTEDDKISFLLTYDKISDLDMPSNYYDWDFNVDKSQRTQLLIRQQEDFWISNCYMRIRVNDFQTVKQELPTYLLTIKPFQLAKTGIFCENRASFSFLEFKYSSDVDHVHNYSSSRLEYSPLFYRSFQIGPLTLTPELGGAAIFYGDTPIKNAQWLTVGLIGCEVQTQLYKYYDQFKHVVEPYSAYHYYSSPTLSPHQHYIFDINDGITRLSQLTLGVTNSFYLKNRGLASKLYSLDLFAHAFFDSKHIHPTVPKLYCDLNFSLIPTLSHSINTAWDFQYKQIDHFNFKTNWTISEDFAISTEYRHRDSYSWRKVDPNNFFLEAFHSDRCLRHSSLSDRRDTFLVHFFYRFLPTWAFEFTSRQGWNRRKEPRYIEYEIDLITTIQTAWHVRMSFQHKEGDNRFAVYLNMGIKKP